jgi:hypothetical protein
MRYQVGHGGRGRNGQGERAGADVEYSDVRGRKRRRRKHEGNDRREGRMRMIAGGNVLNARQEEEEEEEARSSWHDHYLYTLGCKSWTRKTTTAIAHHA